MLTLRRGAAGFGFTIADSVHGQKVKKVNPCVKQAFLQTVPYVDCSSIVNQTTYYVPLTVEEFLPEEMFLTEPLGCLSYCDQISISVISV